jgi:hypothetical protein
MRFKHAFPLFALAVSVGVQTVPLAAQMSEDEKAAKQQQALVQALTSSEELCALLIKDGVSPTRRPVVCACFAGGFALVTLLQPKGMYLPNSRDLTEDGTAVVRVIREMCTAQYSKK